MLEAEINPDGISAADLVVCILSHDEADSIGADSIGDSTRRASEGLVQYFSDKPSVIINFDSSSKGNTKEVFLGAGTEVPKIFLPLPPRAERKGNEFRNLFRKVVELGAKGIMVFEARLNSITPEGIRRLGEPLFNGFSYVAPLHVNRRFDGTITNAIAYPIFRTLYGRRIRQPLGREFSFSGDLARVYVENPLWDMPVTDYGNHMWMTAVALTHGARVCQSFMGNGRVPTGEDADASLSPRFEQDVETIFLLMSRFESHWLEVKYSRPTAVVGFGEKASEAAARSRLDTHNLFTRFQDGFSRFESLWGEVFSKDVFLKLGEIKGMKHDVFDFPTELWARLLYEMSVACRDREKDPRLLIRSLMPLFWGKTFSFMKKTNSMAPHQIEGVIEEECMIFEMTKPYLVKRWTEGHKPASPERP